MANLRQAPKLYHTGKKHQGNFYQLPQDLMDIVFNKLDGKCGNQIKLIQNDGALFRRSAAKASKLEKLL